MSLTPVVVKRVRDAQFAYCPTCDDVLESPYWHFTKSASMHQRGTGHKVLYMAYA